MDSSTIGGSEHGQQQTMKYWQENVSKFGALKLFIPDGVPQLVTNATKVYLNKKNISQSVTTPY